MTPGFQNLPYEGATLDGQNWTGLKPLQFLDKRGRLWRTVIGATTDGPSDPLELGKLDWGPVWVCGVLHDACYRDQIEVLDQPEQEWNRYSPTKEESDSLFNEAMEAQGVPPLHRELFYRSVVMFGHKSFKQDRG